MSVRKNKWRRVARQSILINQKGRCVYCYQPLQIGTLEHIKPQKDGGTDDRCNLAVACQSCNQAKGCMSVGKFRKQIKNKISIHWARRKIFVRGMRAERNIMRYVGKEI